MKVKLENVRRLADCELHVAPNAPTVLIGTNNSGKSTVLEALSAAIRSLPGRSVTQPSVIPTTMYRVDGGALHRPKVQLHFDSDELLPPNKSPPPKASYAIDAIFLGRFGAQQVNSDQPGQAMFIPTSLQVDGGEYIRQDADFMSVPDLWTHSFNIATLIRGESEEWVRPEFAGNLAILGIYSHNNPAARLLGRLVDNVFYLPAARGPTFAPHSADRRLSQLSLMEVTPLLKRIKGESAWISLQSAIRLLFDEVDDIGLKEQGGELAPFVKLLGGWAPVSDMGYGFRNAFHILTLLAVAPERALFLIDEPEIGLNQSKQRDLAGLMESIRRDVTIVAATQAEAFCKGLRTSSVQLMEPKGSSTVISAVDIRASEADRQRLALAMGMDPLYLAEGGKILFVEGRADKHIVGEWAKLNFGPMPSGVIVQDLGGAGKLAEEFAKPLFKTFAASVFFLLDSDGSSDSDPVGKNIKRLVDWLRSQQIENVYVLKRREIENYIGPDALARVVDVHPSRLGVSGGDSRWIDYKALIKDALGHYDEPRVPRLAFDSLTESDKRDLFAEEGKIIRAKLKAFLGMR